MRKFVSIFVLLLIVAGALFGYFRYYFVFGEGVKSGELNYVVHKGLIFKTYEGKLIQSGFRTQRAGLQSYEFEFSVLDEKLAEQLMLLGGQNVELHYKEYFGSLPWRGVSKYVVDSIVASHPNYYQQQPPVVPLEESQPVATPEIKGGEI
jgi:hypothetical protein